MISFHEIEIGGRTTMEVTASMVKELRERTGAGMMDCKKALVETAGDMDKAIELLREKGLAKAARKPEELHQRVW